MTRNRTGRRAGTGRPDGRPRPSHGYRMVPVVALGGSTGSIEALQHFFAAMPPKSGLAFVVVIHLSRTTTAPHRGDPALHAHEGGQGVGDPRHRFRHVYVIPPGQRAAGAGRRPAARRHPRGPARHVAVDLFFRTLADTHGAHAAAVVLSGMDGDGAIGIKRIKERGGLTVAQDLEQAEHASMPRTPSTPAWWTGCCRCRTCRRACCLLPAWTTPWSCRRRRAGRAGARDARPTRRPRCARC